MIARWLTHAMSHRRILSGLVLFALLCGSGACGGSQNDTELMQNEAVLTCEALLDEFAQLDTETATEDELVTAMEKADAAAEACETRFREQADGLGDELLFAHRSDQLRLFSLFFEAALSRRYDNFSGYCAILSDLVRIIIDGINQEQLAIESGELSPQDERKVRELLQLDVQTLEVVSIQVDSRCAR